MHNPVTPYGDEHTVTLSPAAPREEVHNRRISCNGFVREDGQYDIEAEITDNKTYSFPSDFRGEVTPDQFVHHMKVRVTIDRSMTVTAAEAITISGPYAICPTANDVFQHLVGNDLVEVFNGFAGRPQVTFVQVLDGRDDGRSSGGKDELVVFVLIRNGGDHSCFGIDADNRLL